MFIRPGEKGDIIAVKTFETRQKITGKRGVGMANMWLVIHIIDRRGKIIFVGLQRCHQPSQNDNRI